jgi:hypothetical protein
MSNDIDETEDDFDWNTEEKESSFEWDDLD